MKAICKMLFWGFSSKKTHSTFQQAHTRASPPPPEGSYRNLFLTSRLQHPGETLFLESEWLRNSEAWLTNADWGSHQPSEISHPHFTDGGGGAWEFSIMKEPTTRTPVAWLRTVSHTFGKEGYATTPKYC